MLIIAYIHKSVVLVIYIIIQNKQSHAYHYTVWHQWLCYLYIDKGEYLDKEESYKNSTKEVILTI